VIFVRFQKRFVRLKVGIIPVWPVSHLKISIILDAKSEGR
jgi:hypothetical protein